MAEPVTIGGQTFIKDPQKGWIDRKTKIPADEGLIKLLSSLETEAESPKKLRLKIDRNREPVTLGDTKFVFDLNQNAWIDEKTKTLAPVHMQAILNSVSVAAPVEKPKEEFFTDSMQAVEGTGPTSPIEQVFFGTETQQSFGMAGQAGSEKIKKPRAKKKGDAEKSQYSAKQMNKINEMIVTMVEHLATIDDYLKQKLTNNAFVANQKALAAREAMIEGTNPSMSMPEVDKKDAEKESSPLLAIGGVAAVIALIATQYKPVVDAVKEVYDHVKGVGEWIVDVAKTFNSWLDFFNGDEKAPAATAPKGSTPQTSTEPSVAAPGAESGGVHEAQPQQKKESIPTIQPPESPDRSSLPAPSPTPSSQRSTQTSPRSNPSSSSSTPSPNTTSGTSKPASSTPNTLPSGSATPTTTPTPSGTKPAPQAQKGQAQATPVGNVPSGNIVSLGRWLQGQGMRVSGHSQFGGRELGQHARNSAHYSDRALDINAPGGIVEANDPVWGPKFDTLAKQLMSAGYSVIWRKKGHYNHIHVQTGGSSNVGDNMSGDDEGIIGSNGLIANAAAAGIEGVKDFVGKLGPAVKALLGGGTYNPNASNSVAPNPLVRNELSTAATSISTTARQNTADEVQSKTPPAPKSTLPPPPVIKNASTGNVEGLPTAEDKSTVLYSYIGRFGFTVPSQSAATAVR